MSHCRVKLAARSFAQGNPISRAAGEHLYETALSADQVLAAGEGGSLHLSATVPQTRGLVFWLLGFGDGVTVFEPAALRDEIKAVAGRMAAAYA